MPEMLLFRQKIGVWQAAGISFFFERGGDALLKQEFDFYRANGAKHPLIEKYGVDARPIAHKDLDKWRYTFTGIQFLHEPTNFLVFGAIDDLWQNSKGEYLVVDYKATAKAEEITELNKAWQISYKRQMEVYQWLLRQNGYNVSNTGYFVYCNGIADAKAFDKKLEFRVNLIPYEGNDSWVEKTIFDIHKCLNSNEIPKANPDCDYCAYINAINKF
jgi:CRISPR/Cas system-associated exonuclease Cas4 (RecB family)